ncbi:MAG TPA: hypothetical protein DDZ04_06550, partial [Parabacteroides sp.]|nr:hypothetical protein [Parabacteroides sp.]
MDVFKLFFKKWECSRKVIATFPGKGRNQTGDRLHPFFEEDAFILSDDWSGDLIPSLSLLSDIGSRRKGRGE